MLRFSDLSGWEETKIRDLAELATGDSDYAQRVMCQAYAERLEAKIEESLNEFNQRPHGD